MRVILAFLLAVVVTPAFAQTVGGLPPEFLSPTLMQGWQAQQPAPTAEEQSQLALRWAQGPNGLLARYSKPPSELLMQSRRFDWRDHQRSTVGQGTSE
jgi:hypothetical protein